ncbi:hypothetical protein AAFR86_01640 (plasmid) [Salmonella enterica subsp. diarizonae serovar 58:r:z53]
MKPQTAVNHGLPRIDAWAVGPVVIGLETLTGQQFGIRNEEVQLKTSFVAVLHPQNAVLVFIESGHQNLLKAGHQFFTLPGR